MTAMLLDGKPVAAFIQKKSMLRYKKSLDLGQRPPGLAVILVGDDPASGIYVKHKHQACLAVGFYSEIHKLPSNTTEQALIALIEQLNLNPAIDGILMQLPLPKEYTLKKFWKASILPKTLMVFTRIMQAD